MSRSSVVSCPDFKSGDRRFECRVWSDTVTEEGASSTETKGDGWETRSKGRPGLRFDGSIKGRRGKNLFGHRERTYGKGFDF